MPRILVTDGYTRSALATVRSLGRAGHTVFVGAGIGQSLAGSSRYAAGTGVLANPFESVSGFVASVSKMVSRLRIEVIVPMTDASLTAFALNTPGRLDGALLAMPDRAAFDALMDKARLITRASSLGLVVPRSVVVHSPAELAVAVDTIGSPFILKPHRSIVLCDDRAHAFGPRYAGSLREAIDLFPQIAYPLMVQEWIPGRGEGVFLLMNGQVRIASFAHRRIREKPPSGGESTYRESTLADPELLAASERILRDAGWVGAAMVEFRRSDRNGAAYLMEVNGRLWGSLQLAIDSGVDFPTLLLRVVLGEPVTPVAGYRVGVRSRWFWGDVDHLIARLRYSREALHLDHAAPSRMRAFLDFCNFFRGDRPEVWRLSDPVPFLTETASWFRNLGR